MIRPLLGLKKFSKQNGGYMKDRFLRKGEVLNRAGFSGSTLWRLERDGKFPKRRRLSPKAVGWLESEVSSWLASRETVAGR